MDLVFWNASTSKVTLLFPADIDDQFGTPVQVWKALTALWNGSSTVPVPVIQLTFLASSTQPCQNSCSTFHAHIQITGVMLLSSYHLTGSPVP